MHFLVTSWHGETHHLTAEQLRDRIRSDSKTNFNWLCSAAELGRVINEPGFDLACANEIRAMILECFAKLDGVMYRGGGGRVMRYDDKLAVRACYNALVGVTDEPIKAAREHYLKEQIYGATSAQSVSEFIEHLGNSFHAFRDHWVEMHFEEYRDWIFVDFDELHDILRADWLAHKKAAEERGEFEADDAEERRAIVQMISNAL